MLEDGFIKDCVIEQMIRTKYPRGKKRQNLKSIDRVVSNWGESVLSNHPLMHHVGEVMPWVSIAGIVNSKRETRAPYVRSLLVSVQGVAVCSVKG